MLNFSWRLRASRQLACTALLALVAGTWIGASPAIGATLEGQSFEETAVLSDRTLRLNGLGLRGVAGAEAHGAHTSTVLHGLGLLLEVLLLLLPLVSLSFLW